MNVAPTKRLPVQFALVLVSAALVPLCFPPVGWWALVILAYAPLLYATSDTTAVRAFYFGMLHGLIGFGTTLFWLYLIFGFSSIPLFTILSTFTGLICLLVNSLGKQNVSAWWKAAMVAVIWTGFEYYRSELFLLRFPWVTPGSSMGPTWLSPVLGVYGMSFLILWAGAALVRRTTVVLGVALSAVVLCLGVFRPGRVEPEEGQCFTVTVVQSEACFSAAYIALTKPAVEKEKPDLIVWPEYALPFDVRAKPETFSVVVEHQKANGAVLVFGTKTNRGSEVGGGWHNTALTLENGAAAGEHYKVRPVHFFDDGTPGTKFTPVPTRLGKVGTPICFDCDYTDVVRRMANEGAEFFAVPSFDSETWTEAQHFQHALLFRLRAAETGRWLACAATSGVSQVIDPHGNVHASVPPMDPGTATARMERRTGKTFFVRAGWLFPWIALGITAVLGVWQLGKALAGLWGLRRGSRKKFGVADRTDE